MRRADARRNDEGPPIPGVRDVPDAADVEMAAYDQLGPRTRRVLDDMMCVHWSSRLTLEALQKMGFDPKAPAVDREMASRLLAADVVIRRNLEAERNG